jgi:hypothetical protein
VADAVGLSRAQLRKLLDKEKVVKEWWGREVEKTEDWLLVPPPTATAAVLARARAHCKRLGGCEPFADAA